MRSKMTPSGIRAEYGLIRDASIWIGWSRSPMQLRSCGVEPLDMPDGEDDVRPRTGLDDAFRLGHRRGEQLSMRRLTPASTI